ncbi:TetR/AcrR family transcriptional regulator [Saccharopolyspora spinosa]|uniref:TetR family transcriptional regulator n=1 Tax=Saccharopolyspora spinosa TaxID=60894 RepID=A0A2N3XU83_SACSN|nr:TetR/AcrR family transcriptional regulator [Saccharopolyspora spinosa]PKW14246.1 TetR family transcriptional regulator [Saccharopolyspora spinosa]
MTTKDASGKRLRADAQRNRERVLAAAQELFAAEGLAVPLDDIARRAGVGPGTVYRHFPTKEALFAAVVVERIQRMVEEARDHATADDPGQAFYDYFQRVIEYAALNKDICDALESTGQQPQTTCQESDFDNAIGTLLARAQQAGAVRVDVTTAEVRSLIVGALNMYRRAVAEQRPANELAILYAGLRPLS